MIVFTLLQFLTAAMASEPKTYIYETRVPAGQLDCAAEARSLERKFEEATGAKVQSATCKPPVDFVAEKNHYLLYPIVLTYATERPAFPYNQPFYPYTAYFGRAQVGTVFPNQNSGIYDSYSDCLNAREAQTQVYERQTGLKAVASGCEPGFGTLSPNYVLHIDGFADVQDAYHKAKHHLYALGFSPIVEGSEDLGPQFAGLISAQGGEEIQRVKDTFLYYSQYEVRVSTDLLASLSSREECISQIPDAQAIALGLGSEKMIVRCLPMSAKTPEGINYLQVIRGGGYFTGRDFGSSSQRYYSFQECVNDRVLAIDEAKKRNSDVVGGICHSDDDRRMYILELFRKI